MPRRHIRDLLATSPAAAQALTQQAQERALLATVRRRLPPQMRAHCVVASRAKERLVLVFDSPAWTTRGRYQAQGIAESLGLSQARVKTQPANSLDRRRRLRRPRIGATAETIANLRATATAVSDPALGEALARLARHLDEQVSRS